MSQPTDPATTSGAPSPATLADVNAGLAQVTDTQRQLNLELANAGQLGQQFAKAMTSAFVGVAAQGKGLGDVLNSLALSLSKMTLNAAFKPLEGAIGGLFNQLTYAPPVLTPGGSFAAPANFPLAAGDGLPTPIPSLTAGGSGFAGGGGGSASAPSVVLNISTPDAESFRRSETQISALVARAVGQGQRNL
jgi:hypothetical protein